MTVPTFLRQRERAAIHRAMREHARALRSVTTPDDDDRPVVRRPRRDAKAARQQELSLRPMQVVLAEMYAAIDASGGYAKTRNRRQQIVSMIAAEGMRTGNAVRFGIARHMAFFGVSHDTAERDMLWLIEQKMIVVAMHSVRPKGDEPGRDRYFVINRRFGASRRA